MERRKEVFWGVAMVLCWLAIPCMSKFNVEKNSLRVISPDDMKGNYDSAIGNFGVPQYGGAMLGTVIYPQQNRNACESPDAFGTSYEPRPGALPSFLLLDRGGKAPPSYYS